MDDVTVTIYDNIQAMLLTFLKGRLPAQEPFTLFFLVVCSSYADFSPAQLYTFILANVAQEYITL